MMQAASTPPSTSTYTNVLSMVSFHIRFPIHILHPTLICKVFIKILDSSPKNKRLHTHCCKGHQVECLHSFYLPSDLPLSLRTNAILLNDQEEKLLRSHDNAPNHT